MKYKALDFGVNFVTGYEFNKNLFVQLNYNAGLTNLANISGFTQRGSQFGLTVGYFFGKCHLMRHHQKRHAVSG